MTQPRPVPYVRIVHQPSSVYRMRYKAEKRTTFLLAENATVNNDQTANFSNTNTVTSSTAASKKATPVRKKNGVISSEVPDGTFPKIEIVNGCGPATLIVSCVSKNEPYHVHPHRLNGECCKSGVAVLNIQKDERFFELGGVSIEFTKRNDIEESINELKSKNVDPFNVGFNFDRNSIDLSQLRLCFQVYLRDSLDTNDIIRDQFHILRPVVSNIICNSSRKSTLQIVRTENLSAPADGNGSRNVVIFMKKLEKDQKMLHAKFYDDSGWFAIVPVTENTIHYQSSTMFIPPKYRDSNIDKDKVVNLKIYVPFSSDKEKAEYIKQQNAEEDEENSMDSTSSQTASAATTSSSAELERDVPDGKYESKAIEFVYTPPIVPNNKRSLDTTLFYEFAEPPEKDVTNEIKEASRKKLAGRQRSLLSEENGNVRYNMSSLSSNFNTDPIGLNHALRHSVEMGISIVNDDNSENIETIVTRDSDIREKIDEQYANSIDAINTSPVDLGLPDSLENDLFPNSLSQLSEYIDFDQINFDF